MKALPVFLCLLWISCYSGTTDLDRQYPPSLYSESGFGKEFADNAGIEDLEVICKIWGFVKYHHPQLCDSTAINPDFELFYLLREAADRGKRKRNHILTKWIDSFGEFEYAPDKYAALLDTTDCQLLSETEWIFDKSTLGKKLSARLQKLRYAERSCNRNIKYWDESGTIRDFNDYPYRDVIEPDCGYRLLSLFRFWNIIEYYYPYKNIIDREWDFVLKNYIPLFIGAEGNGDYKKIVARLVTEINDTHAFYQPPSVFGNRKLPLRFRFVDGKMVVREVLSSLEQYRKIKIGDLVVGIDDKTPCDILTLVGQYVSCSNRASLLRRAAEHASFVSADTVKFLLSRRNEEMEVLLPAAKADLSIKREVYTKINDSIGYLYPASPQEETERKRIKQKIDEVDILIVDHRCYPLLTPQIFFDFFLSQKTHITDVTVPSSILPGYFTYSPQIHGEDNPDAFNGKIVVLVDEQTQSMAEYTTMAFQAIPGTLVIGSQTAGADGDIAWVLLPGNIKTAISGLGVYYPDNTPTQRVGIKIDHHVEPTIEGIRAGRDEVLKKALEIINSGR